MKDYYFASLINYNRVDLNVLFDISNDKHFKMLIKINDFYIAFQI